MNKKIKKINLKNNPGKLKKNLDRYVKLATENGATAACIIPTENIVLDERVRMKCRFPVCEWYATCLNCPPHTGSVDEMRTRVGLYKHAIVFKVEFPDELAKGQKKQTPQEKQIIYKIISLVESAAFYDGYYFATGFGAGSCRSKMCNNQPCQALQGLGCRFKARAYASMEAVGMDVYRIATSLGWDIYPIGRSCKEKMVPYLTRLGLILIA